jgi:PAS domain S-box-containing protein
VVHRFEVGGSAGSQRRSANEEPRWSDTFEQQLANLPAGSHLCHFYDTPDERLQASVPFCREGLRRKQRCVCFLPPAGVPALVRALRTAGVRQPKRALERGDLVPITTREPYVRDDRFAPEAMRAYLDHLATQAEGANKAALRVVGQMDWVLEPDVDMDRFLRFEGGLLNEFATTTGASVLCQFSRTITRPEVIYSMLRTHPLVVVGAQVVDNSYYEPGPLVLEDHASIDQSRVSWMLGQLHDKSSRDMAVADLEKWSLSDASLNDLMNAATHLIARELRAKLAESFEVEAPDNTLRLLAEVGWREQPVDRTHLWGLPADVFLGRLSLGHPLIVNDWASETRFKRPAALAAEEISSSAVVAISTLRDAHLYGALAVHFDVPRTFSSDDIAFVERVAAALASAISWTRSEEQFRTLAEHVPDLIGRFDAELRFLYANTALEATAEAPPEPLVGKTLREARLPEALIVPVQPALQRAWQTGRQQTVEFSLESPSGARHWQGAIIPQRSTGGSVESLLLIAHDFTEQRRAASEPSKLYDEVLAQQVQLQELAQRLVQHRQRESERRVHVLSAERLTDRERQIMPLLAAGWTNREIAAQLGLAVGTVKNRVAAILRKLDVSDRTQAAVRAVELGLAEPSS